MDNTVAASHKTELNDRTLWFDGKSSFDPNKLLYLIRQYKVEYVNKSNDTIVEYNRNVSRDKEIKVKTECDKLSIDWTTPKKVQELDVEAFLFQAHEILFAGIDEAELAEREHRLCTELIKYKKLQLYPVLRTIIWIINKLETNNVVWGVGRGSSVASYVLYVIGVHDVDSFTYELDIDDFLHD